MELTATRQGPCLVVEVGAAEVDHTVSDDFKDMVLERFAGSSAANLLLDLGRVAFMDSKAIGAMVSIRKAVANHGGRFAICSLHPHVEKVIRVVTLGTIFDVFPDKDAALARLAV
jgi:anti-sigma B factor antagonist